MTWSMHGQRWFVAAALLLAAAPFIGGCAASSDDAEPETVQTQSPQHETEAAKPLAPEGSNGVLPAATAALEPAPKASSPRPEPASLVDFESPGSLQVRPPADREYFSTNQQWLEGLYAQSVDLRDVTAVFRLVFNHLPDEVSVYPSENYYYFKLFVNGRQMWGNIRLAAGHREKGELSFAYFEFDEFAYNRDSQFTRAKMFTASDGVEIREIDHFTYVVTYKDKRVKFSLLRLPQDPPRHFELGRDEVFVERTFDESGYQFFLLFNEAYKYFFWVLNEEVPVPDTLLEFGTTGDLMRGLRSGFVFWIDALHQDRKVLASIRQQSVERNDYFDGPFDQLADNYADEVRISEFMVKASPSLEGRIDKYGYFTDQPTAMRVALSMYATHYYDAQVLEFMDAARATGDVPEYVARRGVPRYTPPAATPAPTVVPTPATATPPAGSQ